MEAEIRAQIPGVDQVITEYAAVGWSFNRSSTQLPY